MAVGGDEREPQEPMSRFSSDHRVGPFLGAGASGKPITFQQRKRPVAVEPVDNLMAVRFRADAAGAVRQKAQAELSSMAEVKDVAPAGVLVVHAPADPSVRGRLMRALADWQKQGLVEFCTPVLRDGKSQLHQILTDEITLRLKPTVSPSRIEDLQQEYHVRLVKKNEFVPNQFLVKVSEPTGLRPLEVAGNLDANDAVEFAAPNFISQAAR